MASCTPSDYSNVASGTTPKQPLDPPSLLVATAVSSSQINLTWQDNSVGEAGFAIERSLDGVSGWVLIFNAPAESESYPNTGLHMASQFFYRVKATGLPADSAYSNVADATTSGVPSNAFVSTWRTTLNLETVSLPLDAAGSYNFSVDWGDGNNDVITAWNQAETTHTYALPGDYIVSISGTCSAFKFNNGGDRSKIIDISDFGSVGWASFDSAFYGCNNLASIAGGDLSGVSNFFQAFRNCSLLTTVGSFDTSGATSFNGAFKGCFNMTSFALLDTSSVTNFFEAWRGCSSLTSFPLIDSSSGTTFELAWEGCSGLLTFPALDCSGAVLESAWEDCSGMTSFGIVNTAGCTNFQSAWQNCSGLTSFPVLDTSSGTNFQSTWSTCSSLSSFPLVDMGNAINIVSCWATCFGLTSFPLLNLGSVTSSNSGAWGNCSGLTSFPLINTSSWTAFASVWSGCSGLLAFPAINTSAGLSFLDTWANCSNLTAFPLLDFSSANNMTNTWQSVTMDTGDYNAILIDLEANNPNNGVVLGAGSSQYAAAPSPAEDARAALVVRLWNITDGGPI